MDKTVIVYERKDNEQRWPTAILVNIFSFIFKPSNTHHFVLLQIVYITLFAIVK